jgi:hypothetical protein
MTLIFTMIGCGKKISEPKSKPEQRDDHLELPAAYVVQLDGAQNSMKNYYMPKTAQFEIPERMKVRKGNTAGQIVEIAYQVNPYDSEDYQFKCSYSATANPTELVLTQCEDERGDFGDVTGQEFGLYQKDIIQVRFKGTAASDMVVEAIYTMEWK